MGMEYRIFLNRSRGFYHFQKGKMLLIIKGGLYSSAAFIVLVGTPTKVELKL